MGNADTNMDFAFALGQWVRFELEHVQKGPWLGFVYMDNQAGLSIKGGPEGSDLVELPAYTIRLPMELKWSVVDPHEAEAKGLPAVPSWLRHYGPQPKADALWRLDPELRRHLHQQFPDDIRVLVHDGEPRRTGVRGEACWVRIRGFQGYLRRYVVLNPQGSSLSPDEFDARYGNPIGIFSGVLLSEPFKLTTVRKGDVVHFIPCPEIGLPLHVTPQYIEECPTWEVQPCNKCGLADALDPPSVMHQTRFPQTPPGAISNMFTAFCANCGGMQMFLMRAQAQRG